MIYIGADHRGFELKAVVGEWLLQNGYEFEDVGNHIFDPDDDYVDYAIKVGEMIEGGEKNERGIIICGSGHGVEMGANRFPRVRAIIGYNSQVTVRGREHEDANILVLPSDWVDQEEAIVRVNLFLQTEKNTSARYEKRRAKFMNLRVR